ncbi:Uncharacterized protein APZ42_020273 [Daphnia magna]|uniref:Uncharacterized protein n=1 Tax=Daphnia magna TaxID=35525 RepID=A0A0P5WGA6_9CRUS|nr:Uncharacterized protein APZ42_020273 [Daphnia magna]
MVASVHFSRLLLSIFDEQEIRRPHPDPSSPSWFTMPEGSIFLHVKYIAYSLFVSLSTS